MARKNTPQYVINSYQKKQKFLPFLIWGIGAIIIALGILLLVLWFSGGEGGFSLGKLFLSATPTPTENLYQPTPTVPNVNTDNNADCYRNTIADGFHQRRKGLNSIR